MFKALCYQSLLLKDDLAGCEHAWLTHSFHWYWVVLAHCAQVLSVAVEMSDAQPSSLFRIGLTLLPKEFFFLFLNFNNFYSIYLNTDCPGLILLVLLFLLYICKLSLILAIRRVLLNYLFFTLVLFIVSVFFFRSSTFRCVLHLLCIFFNSF